MTEITIPVRFAASLTIRVPSEVWSQMDDFDKRGKIEAEITAMQCTIDREGGFQCGTSTLYGTIDDWAGDDISEGETEVEC